MQNKKEILRLKAKETRKNLNIKECSKKLVKQIRTFEIYQNSQNVMIYYPIQTEYNLLELLEDNKNFLFPKTNENEIIPVLYDMSKGFKKGKFDINEPIGNEIKDYKNIDLIILPALACDKRGNRLGYGKGYYDKFLKTIDKSTITAIAISNKLLYKDIYTESHDIKVNYLITEDKILNLND